MAQTFSLEEAQQPQTFSLEEATQAPATFSFEEATGAPPDATFVESLADIGLGVQRGALTILMPLLMRLAELIVNFPSLRSGLMPI